MIDEEVDEFLEHFGIKGQRWGIRRDRKTGVRPIAKSLDESRFGRFANRNVDRHNKRKKKKASLTRAEREKRKEKIVNLVSAGIITTYAAVYVAATLAAYGQQSATRPPPGFGGGRRSGGGPSYRTTPLSVREVIEKERNTQLYSLRRTHKEGHIDKEQLVNFIKILNKRYDRRLFDAGK